MGILRSLFGSSKNEIWSQVAQDIGGEYIDGGFWGNSSLHYTSGDWEFVLDTYTVSNGKSSTTYTRMRVPFINKDDLYFKLYRENFFSSIGKFFGMQDIEVGDPYFDEEFIIKGNSEEKIKLMLQSEKLKSLFKAQPQVSVQIKDDEGFFNKTYPHGVDLLHFQCLGVIKDTSTLKNLFELFTAILERLVEIDSAYESNPNITL